MLETLKAHVVSIISIGTSIVLNIVDPHPTLTSYFIDKDIVSLIQSYVSIIAGILGVTLLLYNTFIKKKQ